MNIIKIFIKKHTFILSVLAFTLLGHIIILNGLPTALQISNYPPNQHCDIDFTRSINLNEYYINNNYSFYQFNSKELYRTCAKMEYWSDNHIALPVYRALKSGQPLSNMGYNEGFLKKNQDPINKYNYQSGYSSIYNNMGVLFYNFIPKRLHHIQTPEQELEAAQYTTKFRFILAYIHLFGMILLFIALYKRLGAAYAWILAFVFAINPGILFFLGSVYETTLISFFLLAYVVYFYLPLLQNYSHKKFVLYTLGFVTISTITGLFGAAYYLLLAWAPVIALMFFIEIYYLYINQQQLTFISAFSLGISRILSICLATAIFLSIIYYIELQEMLRLYGSEAIDLQKARVLHNFLHTSLITGEFQKITTLQVFITHMRVFYDHIINNSSTLPALWIELFMPKLLLIIPPILRHLKILYLLILFGMYILYAFIKIRTKLMPILIILFFATLCYLFWTIGLNVISSFAGYHLHITLWVFSFYLTLTIALFTTAIFLQLKQNKQG